VTLYDNTLIEHATVAAIKLTGPAGTAYLPPFGKIIESDEVVYNQNGNGIRIEQFNLGSGYTGVYPFDIKRSIFTARYFCPNSVTDPLTATNQYPFTWPTANYLKTPSTTETGLNPSFNIDGFQAYSESPNIGIVVENTGYANTVACDNIDYYGVSIGDSSAIDNTNMYDTIQVGIWITNANVRSYNSIFRRTSRDDAGIGIYGRLNIPAYYGEKRTIELLHGYQNRTNNRFYNCYRGVEGEGWYNLVCKKAEIYTTIYYGGTTAAQYTTGIRNKAANSLNRYFSKMIIENNTIKNYRRGIDLELHSCFSTNSCNQILITNNVLSDENVYSSSGAYGISVNDIGNCSVRGANLLIEANNVTGMERGIYLYGESVAYSHFNADINNNEVQMTYETGAGTYERIGIESERAKYVKNITNNHIYGNTSEGFSYNSPGGISELGHAGIVMQMTSDSIGTKTDVACNYVHDIMAGFRFYDGNAIRWHKNVMARNSYGMVLHENPITTAGGVIGDQVDTCTPMDNIWLNSGGWPGWASASGTYQTYCVGSSTSLSKLYARPNIGSLYILTPTVHGPISGGTPYSNGTTVLPVSVYTCVASIDTCGAYFEGEGGGGEGSRPAPGRNGRYNGNANEWNSYTVFPNPGDGNLTIQQANAVNTSVKVKVLDYAGAMVQKGTLTFKNGTSKLNVGKVAAGVYMVILTDDNGTTNTFRVVIQ
jgi:hypothetical protein